MLMRYVQLLSLITGQIRTWIDEVGREKIGNLVTDQASAMRCAREEVVATEGYTHILQMRWGVLYMVPHAARISCETSRLRGAHRLDYLIAFILMN